MVLRMARPTRHPTTGIFLFRRRVPDALRPLVGKREEKVSLGTRDPSEARIAHARVSEEVEARWKQLTAGVITLTARQAEAVAGEIYRELVAEHEDDPTANPSGMSMLFVEKILVRGEGRILLAGDKDKSAAWLERMRTQRHDKRIQAWLDRRGLRLDDVSRDKVRAAVAKAILQAREQLERMEDGDYRPDPDADRFPALDLAPRKERKKSAGTNSPLAVFEAYAAEAALKPATVKRWRPVLTQVQKDHADLADVTREWVLSWKDRLVASGLAPKSIREVYLASLRAVCEWAVANGRIPENPASKIKLKVPAAAKTRPQGFTDDEAQRILAAALAPPEGNLSPKHKAARRWVPWLCAYTGARVGEMAQLRREDVQQQDAVWMLHITPEAGTTKDGNARFVALHPVLVEQGFVGFVRGSRPGPLFYEPRLARPRSRYKGRPAPKPASEDENPQFRKVGQRLAKWVRQDVGITDAGLRPNHAWRHRFKSQARKCGMDPGARDYMQGHSPATVGEEYGDWTPEALHLEISKLPAVEIEPTPGTDGVP